VQGVFVNWAKTLAVEICAVAMDEGVRNQVEGKFGEAKRRFSLNLVMTKLAETSCTQHGWSVLTAVTKMIFSIVCVPFVNSYR